jgi:hypothetical protein
MRFITSLWIAVCIAACAEKYTGKELIALEKLLADHSLLTTKISRIIVIPTTGCHGCIQKMASFALREQYDSTLFVLTGKSAKDISLVIDFNDNQNGILIDSNGVLFKGGAQRSFPVLYHVQNEVIGTGVELNGNNLDSTIVCLKK